MEIIQLLGSAMGLALVAGINLYATVLTVGLGLRYDFIHLPPHLDALSILAHPYILITAILLYTLEFFADKIPWVDSLWDSIHTIIRPFGAAVIGVKAIGSVDPTIELSIFLLCGGIGFSTHSTKASIRLAANHSPEPFSNSVLSFVEDITVVGGTWFALTYPILMFFISLVFIVFFVFFAPKIFRILRMEFLAILAICRSVLKNFQTQQSIVMFDNIPKQYNEMISNKDISKNNNFCIRCFSGKGLNIGRNYIGFLCMIDNKLFLLSKKWFRIHKIDIETSKINTIKIKKKILLGCLSFKLESKDVNLLYLKDKQLQFEKIINILNSVS